MNCIDIDELILYLKEGNPFKYSFLQRTTNGFSRVVTVKLSYLGKYILRYEKAEGNFDMIKDMDISDKEKFEELKEDILADLQEGSDYEFTFIINNYKTSITIPVPKNVEEKVIKFNK